ncbi:unnamed protein product [Lactuca virosa]|uniref:V-SNARE coiled-coil homology domain-containing protein n=1 Tax=Lactuca virosa TaxID=75947 RepID=A0AAU9PRL2_9ASTR|nr:unnamed protein product [Lactuca virosa]
MASEYRETVQRRYYTVTGENPDESTVDNLISTGQSETFLQKAIQEQGRGQVMDTILEIKERHDAVKEIERNLKELHQVNRASSFVNRGATHLQVARKHQKNTRKWACFGIILVLIVILIIILSIRPWESNGSGGGGGGGGNPTPSSAPPPPPPAAT